MPVAHHLRSLSPLIPKLASAATRLMITIVANWNGTVGRRIAEPSTFSR